jgi:transcriptional regulator with XRE-family HTH domain
MKRGAPVPDPGEIGHVLRAAREGRGMSLREAGRRTGGLITHRGIHRIEVGERSPTVRTVEILARIYGVRISIDATGVGYVVEGPELNYRLWLDEHHPVR